MGNTPVDAVTVEVVRAALNAAAERMRITMIKTAYNHIISESLDFGCAIFDPDVQMIAQGIGLPVFQGHLGFPIQATIADRGLEAFREGDVFIHNDPYTGNGNHLNDVAMFAPGVLGGAARRLRVGEGALERRGRPRAELDAGGLHRLPPGGAALPLGAALRSRPAERRGHAGHRREHPHRERHAQGRAGDDRGLPRRAWRTSRRSSANTARDTVIEATRVYMEQSERRTRAELAKMPAGVYRAVGHFDNDGITLDRPVRVEMAITISDGGMTRRFHGIEPAGGGAVQLRRRHHDQRLPPPHQVPDDAARPGGRGLLPAPRRDHPAAVRAGRRGARTDRAVLRARSTS